MTTSYNYGGANLPLAVDSTSGCFPEVSETESFGAKLVAGDGPRNGLRAEPLRQTFVADPAAKHDLAPLVERSRKTFRERQNAGNDRCSHNRHPPTTSRSRIVAGSQNRRYRPPVMFLMRIRKRFFTECMLMTAGTDRRLPGPTLRTW